jgi:hypothetical protein
LKTKDNALNCFKIYKAEIEYQLEKKIKKIYVYSKWRIFL